MRHLAKCNLTEFHFVERFTVCHFPECHFAGHYAECDLTNCHLSECHLVEFCCAGCHANSNPFKTGRAIIRKRKKGVRLFES